MSRLSLVNYNYLRYLSFEKASNSLSNNVTPKSMIYFERKNIHFYYPIKKTHSYHNNNNKKLTWNISQIYHTTTQTNNNHENFKTHTHKPCFQCIYVNLVFISYQRRIISKKSILWTQIELRFYRKKWAINMNKSII